MPFCFGGSNVRETFEPPKQKGIVIRKMIEARSVNLITLEISARILAVALPTLMVLATAWLYSGSELPLLQSTATTLQS